MNKLRQPLTEFIAIFIMVFAGTSTIVINDLHCSVIKHMGIALFLGLAVAAAIDSLGNIS